MKEIAIIGAGFSTAVLCHYLNEKNLIIFEKARGPGGRSSTRKVDTESLKAAGVNPDGEAKVGEVKKPPGNGLNPKERQDALNSDLTTADKLGPESDVLVYGKDGKTEYQRGLERLGASPEEAKLQAERARANALADR